MLSFQVNNAGDGTNRQQDLHSPKALRVQSKLEALYTHSLPGASV